MLNPPRRYIFNANQIATLEPHIAAISDLKNSSFFKPLQGGANLVKARVLVERYRDRGIGDLLFLTGPLNFIQHVSGGECTLDVYTLTDRGQIIADHPAISNRTPLAGPVHYDDLKLYQYHWFIDTVTEYDEEAEQLNVYDALYQSIGIDPKTVDPRFKRPTASIADKEWKNLDSLFYFVWLDKKIDLRRVPYYVVAPHSHSSLRSAPYSLWVKVISELAKTRPVVVIGHVMEGRMPATDMSFGAFNQQISGMGGGVINLMGGTPIRLMMALIARSTAVVCLDSGPLYIAQAFRVPAVSVWGPHHPGVRIGYDRAYMDLAVWNKEACVQSPCFAYSHFPAHKCPQGAGQTVCEVLSMTEPKQILDKIAKLENDTASPFKSYQAAKA